MANVKKQVGEENVVFILTADHGVADFPEILAQQGVDAKRIERPQYEEDIAAIDALLQKEFNLTESTISKANYSGVEPALSYLAKQGIDTDVFCKSLQEKLKQLPYIEDTYSMTELSDSSNNSKKHIQAMRNSFDPRYGYYISLVPKEHYLIDMWENGTTHGTPYAYDTHVPLIFLGKDIEAQIVNKAVGTIDIAPTILGLLQIKALGMDGKNLFTE
jgi:arylsulfatase A-like enzyme